MGEMVKRLFDIVVALILLVTFSPFLILGLGKADWEFFI